MEESLRRAYLAAMEVPLWLPRELVAAEVARHPPRMPRVQRSGEATRASAAAASAPLAPVGARAQTLLDVASRTPTSARPLVVPSRATRDAGAPVERVVLRLALAGATLFIDELPLSPAEPGPAEELLRAVALVLERGQSLPASHDFAWPPAGRAWDEAEARDALIARLGKLRAGVVLRQAVVMGETPARLLLGVSAGEFAVRGEAPSRVPALDCPLLVLPSASAMLREPALKRVAWRALCLALRSDG